MGNKRDILGDTISELSQCSRMTSMVKTLHNLHKKHNIEYNISHIPTMDNVFPDRVDNQNHFHHIMIWMDIEELQDKKKDPTPIIDEVKELMQKASSWSILVNPEQIVVELHYTCNGGKP